jgi:dihydrofolate reductase
MRRLRYNVAASLDGFIAGPHGEFDWIPDDATVDFAALFTRIDTVLMGRRTYESLPPGGELPWKPTDRVYVVSSTLQEAAHSGVTITDDDPVALTASLRAEPGDGEIWLFGGGALFATLLAAHQVDSVEVTVAPVLLGGGVPLLPPGVSRTALRLRKTHVYPSGMVALHYDVPDAATET